MYIFCRPTTWPCRNINTTDSSLCQRITRGFHHSDAPQIQTQIQHGSNYLRNAAGCCKLLRYRLFRDGVERKTITMQCVVRNDGNHALEPCCLSAFAQVRKCRRRAGGIAARCVASCYGILLMQWWKPRFLGSLDASLATTSAFSHWTKLQKSNFNES